MIGLLRGKVVVRSAEGEVIVDVAGVGYRVAVTPATAAALMVGGGGAEATLFIHTHVREDAIVLYGFVHDDERRCFEVLLGSHGVGPALALAIMAVLSPASLSTAVLEDDLETLCTVPGVGRKTAARLLIELKSRLDLPDLSLDLPGAARRRRQPHLPGRGAGRAERAGLRARGDPWRARRLARRCRGGRDAAAGAARAGRPVSPKARREVLATGDEREPGRRRRDDERLVAPVVVGEAEEVDEAGLRPRSLTEFVGQAQLVEHLRIVIQAARQRRQPSDHLLFAGPPGPGQDVPGRDRGHRNGGRAARHVGPRADPGRRSGRAADRPPGR